MAKHVEGCAICTGCGACVNLCPVGAVSMAEDNEGFLRPVVGLDCTECGICASSCPALNPVYVNSAKPACYAAKASDELRLGGSSSGAVFPVLAEHVLKQGGLVCGAAYKKDFSGVEHVMVHDMDALQALKGSKYMQSEVGNCYEIIKNHINDGRFCLFSGTPCQVAGLYAVLGGDHEKLLTVDLVCHGVPSAMIFQRYLAEYFAGEKIISVDMRDKAKAWGPQSYIKIETDKRTYLSSNNEDPYLRIFLNDLSLRNSCAICPFNKIPRQGDLTLGDFWGYAKFDKKRRLDDGLGLSVITANSGKGDVFVGECQSAFKYFKKAPLKIAIGGNINFIAPSKHHRNRRHFLNDLQTASLADSIGRDLDGFCDVLILNLWFTNNYGAVLTAYALFELVEEFGFLPQLANFYPKSQYESGISIDFASKYFRTTNPCRSNDDFVALNDLAETFIVGSDQVWRRDPNQYYHYIFFLDFVANAKKKIACSASFAVDRFDLADSIKGKLRQLARQFDHVSVREYDGVDICKETFGLEAEHLLDPVFALDHTKYEELAEKSTRKDSNFILSYSVSQDSKKQNEYREAESFLASKLNLDCIQVLLNNKGVSIEDWLYLFKNSSFIMTDSFHGVCFALIYNKPFVAIDNKVSGASRFNSLFRTFRTYS